MDMDANMINITFYKTTEEHIRKIQHMESKTILSTSVKLPTSFGTSPDDDIRTKVGPRTIPVRCGTAIKCFPV